jgi:large subunit ribosomal protein L31
MLACQLWKTMLDSSSNQMKKDIHPQYYPDAKIKCACGQEFRIGSTKPEIKIEICSRCHPFYTGSQEFIDVAGRVEKFKARKAKAKPKIGKKSRIKKKK